MASLETNPVWFDRFYMSCVNYAQDLEKIYKLTYSPIEEVNMKKEFTKADLENRMVVEYRDGQRRMVVDNDLIGEHISGYLTDYNDDLTSRWCSDLDIIRVFGEVPTFNMLSENCLRKMILWERKEPKEIKEVTLKEIAEKFGVDEVKVIEA